MGAGPLCFVIPSSLATPGCSPRQIFHPRSRRREVARPSRRRQLAWRGTVNIRGWPCNGWCPVPRRALSPPMTGRPAPCHPNPRRYRRRHGRDGITVLTCQPADPATKGGAEASVELARPTSSRRTGTSAATTWAKRWWITFSEAGPAMPNRAPSSASVHDQDGYMRRPFAQWSNWWSKFNSPSDLRVGDSTLHIECCGSTQELQKLWPGT